MGDKMKNVKIMDMEGDVLIFVKEKKGKYTVTKNSEFKKLKVEIRDDKNNLIRISDQADLT